MTTFERSSSDRQTPREAAPGSSPFRGDGPAPFLSQLRAQSALRHELAAIEATIEPELERRRASDGDVMFEMHVVPNRLIARLGSAGLSFSWIGGQGGQSATVAEGRLLVIEWAGVADETRGVAALRSARAVRERTYRPEGADAEHWRWRVDGDDTVDGVAYTTTHLVSEWLEASELPRAS